MIIDGYGVPMEILLRIWACHKDITVFEISHPPIYNGIIGEERKKRYKDLKKRKDQELLWKLF